MTRKPYTRADVELVERTIHDVTPPIRDGYVDGRDLLNAEACAVLDALAAEGRLLPTGTETEYGYRCGEDCTQPHRASEESARTKVRAMRNGTVVRRLAGPWTSVEEPARALPLQPAVLDAAAHQQEAGETA
jgi:alpha-D-ribose 1-methylphosphonate 5-triphosphate synthase subunit PhnG